MCVCFSGLMLVFLLSVIYLMFYKNMYKCQVVDEESLIEAREFSSGIQVGNM